MWPILGIVNTELKMSICSKDFATNKLSDVQILEMQNGKYATKAMMIPKRQQSHRDLHHCQPDAT